jgi:hypothetical protein
LKHPRERCRHMCGGSFAHRGRACADPADHISTLSQRRGALRLQLMVRRGIQSRSGRGRIRCWHSALKGSDSAAHSLDAMLYSDRAQSPAPSHRAPSVRPLSQCSSERDCDVYDRVLPKWCVLLRASRYRCLQGLRPLLRVRATTGSLPIPSSSSVCVAFGETCARVVGAKPDGLMADATRCVSRIPR